MKQAQQFQKFIRDLNVVSVQQQPEQEQQRAQEQQPPTKEQTQYEMVQMDEAHADKDVVVTNLDKPHKPSDTIVEEEKEPAGLPEEAEQMPPSELQQMPQQPLQEQPRAE